MLIYWLVLTWTVFVSLTYKKWFIFKVKEVGGTFKEKPLLLSYLLAFAPLLFVISMRTQVADTVNYIEAFNSLTPTFSAALKIQNKDKLFYQVATLFKMLVPNVNAWFFFVAFFQVLFICLTVRRYSEMPGVSLFLFVASVEFAYMFNGMRQFVAVTILFAGYRLLIKKKYFLYILLIILAAQFHGTAYVMLVGLVFSFVKPWSKTMYVSALGFTAAMVFLDPILSGLKIFFEDTEYSRQMTELLNSAGVNVIRVFVAFVPLVLGFVFRKNKALFSRREFAISFNMSILNAAFFTAASIVGGNLMARFAEYFTIYQLLTYPSLFKNCFKKGSERTVVVLLFGIFYCVWFWYQMDVNWEITYISDVLGWNF